MTEQTTTQTDEAEGKGAVEEDGRTAKPGQSSMGGQLGHRDQEQLLKENDTDFPEPDAKAEHSGH